MAARSASYLASAPEASVTICFAASNAVAFRSKLENISVLDESPWDLTILSTAEQLIGWMRHEFLNSANLTNARDSFFGIDGCRWLAQLLSRSITLLFGAAPIATGIDDFAHSEINTTRHSNGEPISFASTQLCNMDSTGISSELAPKLLFCLVKNGFLMYSCGGSAPDEKVMMERSSIFSFELPPNLMNVAYVHLTASRSASEVSQSLIEMAKLCPFSRMPQPQHDFAVRMDHLSCELQRIRLDNMNSKDLLCFYINTYNFMVVHAKLKGRLPNCVGTSGHNRDRIAAFQTISYLIGNKIHNLFNIECSLLGRSLRDSVNMTSQFSSWDTTSTKSRSAHSSLSPEPRLLFLLCKGTVSCPRIRMVTADNLQVTMKNAMKEYVADHRDLPTTQSKLKTFFQGYQNILWMPRVFKWHAGDFGMCAYDTVMFYLDQLEEYESRDFRATIKTTRCSTKIEFFSYDWSDRKTNWFEPRFGNVFPGELLPLQTFPTPPISVASPVFQRHILASSQSQSQPSPRSPPFSPRSPPFVAAIPFSPPPAPFSPREGMTIASSARRFVSSEKRLPAASSAIRPIELASQFPPHQWDAVQEPPASPFPPLGSSPRSQLRMLELAHVAELEGSSPDAMKAGSIFSSGDSQTLPAYNSYSESMQFQYDNDFMEADMEENSESEDDMYFVDDATITSHVTTPLDRQSMGGSHALNFASSLTSAPSQLSSLSAAKAFRHALAKTPRSGVTTPGTPRQMLTHFSHAQSESF
jgi:hypothetical protein